MFRLMLVTDRHVTHRRDLVDVVVAACRGGVDAVQLRERDLSGGARAALLEQLRARLPIATRLIVNGDVELARRAWCGLHLPAGAAWPTSDCPTPIGRSTHGELEIKYAVAEGPDYLLFGHIFDTPSHALEPGRGLAALHQAVALAGRVPVIAIGGIRAARVREVRDTGAAGIAVMRDILEAADPEQAARTLREEWDRV